MKENSVKTTIQASSYDGKELFRVCPKCEKEKRMEDFGLRKMPSGEIRNQSWCKKCRGTGI